MKVLVSFISAFALLLPASAPASELGIWDRIKGFFSGEPASASQSAEKSPAKESTPPKPLDPVAEAARHEAAVKESLKTVTTMYPAVLEKGTIFNEEFCARLHKLQAENPDAMKDDNWPMELAKKTERGMLLEQYESAEVRRQMTEVPPADEFQDAEIVQSNEQRRLHLPLAVIEPPMAPDVSHVQEWESNQRRRYNTSYWRSNPYSWSGYYPNGYYNWRNYDYWRTTVPMNSYVAGPEVSTRVRNLASQFGDLGRTSRQRTNDCAVSPQPDWRSRFSTNSAP